MSKLSSFDIEIFNNNVIVVLKSKLLKICLGYWWLLEKGVFWKWLLWYKKGLIRLLTNWEVWIRNVYFNCKLIFMFSYFCDTLSFNEFNLKVIILQFKCVYLMFIVTGFTRPKTTRCIYWFQFHKKHSPGSCITDAHRESRTNIFWLNGSHGPLLSYKTRTASL